MAARFAKESAAIPIVSSPATRALATAKHFAKAMGVSKDEIVKDPIIYGASANDMLRLIQNLSDNWDAVILFGHNPTFSELAYLLDHSFTDHLVTCARVKISCDVPSWAHINPNIGLVDYHDYPRKYPEMENL
jgi:phosphohistidine phosphatase